MPERFEATLVRALQLAYDSGTAPSPVESASAYQWANACHELFEAGRIHLLEYAVRHLHPIYPDLTYLTTLVTLFDAVPRHLPAPLAFADDPAAEIQIVRRPDCADVLLCFCASQGTLGLPVDFMHQWLGRLPASLVYIKDHRELGGGCGYSALGPDRASAIAGLWRIAGEIGGTRICALGVSRGGYAALYYGLKLDAASILSLAGATDYTPDFVKSLGPVSPQYLDLCEHAPDYLRNLGDDYISAPHRPRVLLAYATGQDRDRRHAERMAGPPNVTLVPVETAAHNVLVPLIQDGSLLSLLRRLLAEHQ